MLSPDSQILAIDVGNVRIGLAIANSIAKLARPLKTLTNNQNTFEQIAQIAKDENVSQVVVGLPVDMNRRETEQTKATKRFAKKLETELHLPVYLIDETLTSVEAEKELRSRGRPYDKGSIDALAATLILEDFLNANEL